MNLFELRITTEWYEASMDEEVEFEDRNFVKQQEVFVCCAPTQEDAINEARREYPNADNIEVVRIK